jgi:hypothetical protein
VGVSYFFPHLFSHSHTHENVSLAEPIPAEAMEAYLTDHGTAFGNGRSVPAPLGISREFLIVWPD